MKVFDYIFFRTYQVYAKHENHVSPSAAAIVCLYQIMTIVNLILLTSILFEYKRPDSKYLVPVFILVFILNWYRYDKIIDIDKLSKDWADEKYKEIRGWLLVLYLLGVVLLPFIYGIANN